MKNIQVQIVDQVVTLTINRPEALNAMNTEMLTELSTALREVADHPEYRCLILRGAGDKAFVAGADISEMLTFNQRQAFDFSLFGNRIFAQLEQLHIPTIAVVHGYALGGGMELAIACDFRIATPQAKFALPETGLGIIPGFGGTFRLARLIGEGHAKHLMYTGKTIDGQEAYRIGLVETLATTEELETVLKEMIQRIRKNSPAALRQLSRLFAYAHLDVTAADFLQEAERFSACFSFPDQKERMQAFLDKQRKV
ncbi:Short-chain-enoyl-CoA hydratase [bioreactor metagenome]|uniref:Short-chain-enoyl-CoA hydratase n=1 Tax=bioreactor metagenome TaxID=1076179 RepID=A0A644ZRN5_9ZZZZ